MSADLDKVSILARREIEARILWPLIEAFKKEFGIESTFQIVGDVIQSVGRQGGAQLASALSGNSLGHYFQALPLWQKEDALKIEVLEQSDTKLSFNVLECRYAKMYKELGTVELGRMLSCNRDFAFIDGFNPKIKLSRTRTIMEGAEYCDFRYELGC